MVLDLAASARCPCRPEARVFMVWTHALPGGSSAAGVADIPLVVRVVAEVHHFGCVICRGHQDILLEIGALSLVASVEK
eukprot:2246470-Pyramimonas_sp.AAC.1